jgi:hypothetical protein
VYFSASSLNFSEANPFGVFGATTWLNLMTIGDCAAAGPTRVNTAIDAAAKINLRMIPPGYFCRARRAGSEACMPVASIQRSGSNCHCPLAGPLAKNFAAPQNAIFHSPAGRMGDPALRPFRVIASEAKQSIFRCVR